MNLVVHPISLQNTNVYIYNKTLCTTVNIVGGEVVLLERRVCDRIGPWFKTYSHHPVVSLRKTL